jgi:hypothetical protein
MLEFVKPHGFAIHSLLSMVKSEHNHTTPILDKVALGGEEILVMPKELVLLDMPDSVFETRGNNLAWQFLKGVKFMHQQNVTSSLIIFSLRQPQARSDFS